jgi:hypothetical protein
VNILNKQLMEADNGCSSSLGVGQHSSVPDVQSFRKAECDAGGGKS